MNKAPKPKVIKPKVIKPKGIYCPNPACLSTTGLIVETVRRPCPGKTVRYRKCKKCGTRIREESRFKAVPDKSAK